MSSVVCGRSDRPLPLPPRLNFLLCVQGQSNLPHPLSGFWAATVVNGSAAVHLQTGAVALGYEDTKYPGAELFYQCQASQCVGGPKFECKDGYTGRLCSACAPGQFYWKGTCNTPCSAIEPTWLVSLILIAVVISIWLGMNKLACSQCARCPPANARDSDMQASRSGTKPLQVRRF